jgi:hypothetical protein
VSVDDVSCVVPKLTRANGWFELFVGDLEEVPAWAQWLDQDARRKALKDAPVICQGKRVWFYDIRDRYDAVYTHEQRNLRVHFGRESIGKASSTNERVRRPER